MRISIKQQDETFYISFKLHNLKYAPYIINNTTKLHILFKQGVDEVTTWTRAEYKVATPYAWDLPFKRNRILNIKIIEHDGNVGEEVNKDIRLDDVSKKGMSFTFNDIQYKATVKVKGVSKVLTITRDIRKRKTGRVGRALNNVKNRFLKDKSGNSYKATQTRTKKIQDDGVVC